MMATVKTSSRSRGTTAVAKENGGKLEEGLNPFKSDRFDAESYVQSNCSLNDKVPSFSSPFSPFYFTLFFALALKRPTVFCSTLFLHFSAFTFACG